MQNYRVKVYRCNGIRQLAILYIVYPVQDTKTMLIALVTPAVAVILGMMVLHEELNWRLYAGGACIIAGIGLIVLRKRQKTVAISEEEPELIPQP